MNQHTHHHEDHGAGDPGHRRATPDPEADHSAQGLREDVATDQEHAHDGDHGPSDDHESHSGHGHHGHAGHDHGDHGDHVAMFRRLFWIMLVISIPVIFSNEMFVHLLNLTPLGYTLPDWGWLPWISPLLGTVMYLWGGQPFLTGARDEIRQRQPGMMLLVALALTVAFIASWGSSLGFLDPELNFWWELALLTVIMLLGHWIEMRSLAQTTSALDSLAALLPDKADKIVGEDIVAVDPIELEVGDTVVVRPGSAVPADGRITEGRAHMDESMITGESRPVTREVGDSVVAGTISTDSGLRVEVTATGDQTALAGIQKLVADAQASSSRAQRIADRAAGWLFWFALGAAAITAVVWAILGTPDQVVVRVITVLVIACPHALGLAIPLVVSIATERAARAGVLVKDRLALESMRTVEAVVFDKTGTLTVGRPTVTGISPTTTAGEDEILALAAAAETPSEHPLASAITRAARDRGLAVPTPSGFSSAPAVGVRATVDGQVIEVGGPYLLEQNNLTEAAVAEQWRQEGAIILHVLADGEVIGALQLADEIRPESLEAIKALHAADMEVVMITGDAQAVATTVAKQLGIDRVFAGVRPADKATRVAELQREGRRVAMVGDGVNDAPALAQADVGIAIGAGTDVAIGSAGVILASSDPRAVLSVVELSRASYRKMVQNLWWAAGYNLAAVPLAAGVLAPIGFVLPMSVGAILMSLSTIVVALNAQLLRRTDLAPENLTAQYR